MARSLKLEKDDLDYYIVSLHKQRQDCSNLLYYYGKNKDAILELRRNIDKRIARVLQVYPVP